MYTVLLRSYWPNARSSCLRLSLLLPLLVTAFLARSNPLPRITTVSFPPVDLKAISEFNRLLLVFIPNRNQTFSVVAVDGEGTTLKEAMELTPSAEIVSSTIPSQEQKAFCNNTENTRISAAECVALVALYSNTNLPNDSSPCTWAGISCSANMLTATIGSSPVISTVTSIKLENYPLRVAIPSELGNLSNLQTLSLISTALTGTIPAELGQLKNLEHLSLHNNPLTGSIPPELGDLSKLKTFSLVSTMLTGTIPIEIGNLTDLKRLLLVDNLLTGTIPSTLGDLIQLETLNLRENQLNGSLPHALAKLQNLKVLDLWCTGGTKSPCNPLDLHGEFPLVLRDLKNLEYLDLSNILIDDPIPPWIGELTKLKELHLRQTGLTGTIPDVLSSLTNLTDLGLSGNELTGTIPSTLGNLTHLKWLNLAENQNLGGQIPVTLKNLSKLEVLMLYSSRVEGPIPPELGWLSSLRTLLLGRNQLTGTIPSTLGDLYSLTVLDLNTNKLEGTIPENLRRLTGLKCLSLGNNQLEGEMSPQLIELFRRLLPIGQEHTTLELSGNNLTVSDSSLREVLNQRDPNWNQRVQRAQACSDHWHYETSQEQASVHVVEVPNDVMVSKDPLIMTGRLNPTRLQNAPEPPPQFKSTGGDELMEMTGWSTIPAQELDPGQSISTTVWFAQPVLLMAEARWEGSVDPPRIQIIKDGVTLKLQKEAIVSVPPEHGEVSGSAVIDSAGNATVIVQNQTSVSMKANLVVGYLYLSDPEDRLVPP